MRAGATTLGLVMLLLGAAPSRAADPPSELGLELLPWSKRLEERRYESPRDFDGTVKFFREKFRGWKQIKWGREVSLPAVKYIHVENTNPAGKWEGINIYAFPDGKVRYYVLERASSSAAGAAPGPSSSQP